MIRDGCRLVWKVKDSSGHEHAANGQFGTSGSSSAKPASGKKPAKDIANSSTNTFLNGKELIGEASIDGEGNLKVNARRFGSEHGDPSRGGTWYEVPAYEGQKSGRCPPRTRRCLV
jgi:hypothetical protein